MARLTRLVLLILLAIALALPAAAASPAIVADPYEPDNNPAQATLVQVGDTTTHNLDFPGDNDWVRFNTTAGAWYAIETLVGGVHAGHTALYLYGPDGTAELAVAPQEAIIAWKAPKSALYYVRVAPRSSDIYGDGTTYDLRIRTFTLQPDAYEPDGGPLRAALLPLNALQTHNCHLPFDVDWVKFSATASTSYRLDVLNPGPQANATLELYDQDGGTLLASDAGTLVWTAPQSGTYYVRVANPSGMLGPDTRYDLRLRTFTPLPPDSYENDNSPAKARPAECNVRQAHNLHRAGDNDWVRLDAAAGTTYFIQTYQEQGPLAGLRLGLYDSDGFTLLAEDERIEWTAPVDGTYYVRVAAANPCRFGPGTEYELLIGSPDAYEPDNSRAEAQPIEPGAFQHRSFHDALDQDWVRFDATAGTTYAIEAVNRSACSFQLNLYGAGPDPLGHTWGTPISWTAPADGPAYVQVQRNGGAFGFDAAYDLRVRTITPTADSYEPDNSPGQARAAGLGILKQHNFHQVGDQDWARFNAVAGTAYIIETLNLAPDPYPDPIISLYQPDGSTLIVAAAGRDPIAWAAPLSATYFVRVAGRDGRLFGPDTHYDLRVRTFTPSPDAYEPDDSPAQARAIELDRLKHHTMHVSTDLDWAFFNATAGVTYTIETLNLGPRCDTYLSLFKAGETVAVRENNNWETGPASRIDYMAPATGTYYVCVRQTGTAAFGPGTEYDLRVRVAD